MHRRHIAAVAAAALTTLAASTPAFARGGSLVPTISFAAAASANYTVAHRPTSSIRIVVIHVTEGSAFGAISWFRNPKAAASANYVVSSTGAITQMVPDTDIAWHAGNWAINRESIGIEHEGYTYRPGSFTDAEYRASARLVGYEVRHYILPIDRRHVIGHNEVPDPNHPGLVGGFAHHTDPGRYWDWTRYMTYVRTYAHGSSPAPHFQAAPVAQVAREKPQITAKVTSAGKVSVSSSGLANGQTVAGYVRWRAKVSTGEVTRVDFLVDGRVRWTAKQQPFEFGGGSSGWDTTRETNGAHVLTLRVVTKKGATAGQSLRVAVANSPFEIAAAGVANGQTVRAKLRWEAVPSGAEADHVDFLVDGKLQQTENEAPYVYGGDGATWDTSSLPNGEHTLVLRAVAVDGRVAESSVTVVVANAAPAQPKPKPTGSSISILLKGVGSGQQVSGVVHWEGATSGGRPDRVEFWIDGRWRWTERSAPYESTWDTTSEQAGTHVLTVRALSRDGLILDAQTITVSVQSRLAETAAPTPTTMAVVSSLVDGATEHASVPWTAAVSGAKPDHVDFLVDGAVRHTETSAPYEFGTWDTTKEQNGPHTLAVRAVARDGTTVLTTVNVLVANAAPVAAALTIASQTLAEGQSVSGSLTWTVKTSGATPDRVEYWVDGKLRHTELSAPYDYAWDTTKDAEGTHQLIVKAIAGSRLVQSSLTVIVKNAVPAPTPTPPPATTPPTAIASQSLRDGQSVSGSVSWQVVTSGAMPDRVEYWIDGTLRSTEKQAPYVFNGDGSTWDTTKETDGVHELVVKAFSGDGRATATITVTVKNTAPSTTPPPATPAPTPTPVPTPVPAPKPTIAIASQTVTEGQTLSGFATWQATVTGDVRRVEFQIDGSRVASIRSAPYGGSLDTRRLPNGTHVLTVRAVGPDGSSVSASVKVIVANS